MSMDWDKLKVFHAAAEAGSFTHAGEQLGLSQSAVSRQVSALEQELGVSLFHRHARGLILTEQGELLHHTAHDVFMKLEAARAKLAGSTVPQYLENRRWLIEVGRNGKGARTPALIINNVLGVLRACQRGIGVALLPDYLVEENGGLVQLFGESDTTIALDAYFVYPEELKTVARVQVFRDFLVAKAQRWHF